MSLTDRLGRYAADLPALAALPPDVSHHARRVVIDWFAAALPGSVCPPATLLGQALAEDLDRGACSLLPDARRATTRTAALINAVAAHTVEFDDIYRDAVYHPGAPVIAAALATAQQTGASGSDTLRAVVAGYELSNRIGRALMPSHYAFWHTTGTAGTFGAAAAAGAVYRLPGPAIGHALANAATMAAGLQQAFRSDAMAKPLHAGRAAEGGLLCAAAARVGVTGATAMLEGERGIGRAMSRDADFEASFADLGAAWTITRTTQKNHGCCGHSFAALDAIIALRNEHRLRADDVAAIEVGTYSTALEVIGDDRPSTPYQARFSLPFCAATALIHGQVRLDAFSPQRLADPSIRDLMARVTLHADPQADALFPGRRSATVAIETRAGARLTRHAPTRKGDPDSPLTDEELSGKFLELATPVLGASAAPLLDRLWHLHELDRADQLATFLTGGPGRMAAAG